MVEQVAFGENDLLRHYKGVDEIFASFMSARLALYVARKQLQERRLLHDVSRLKNRVRKWQPFESGCFSKFVR